MAILETFPNKSGHTITDDSSPITERESVNLIDFDVADDSTNEKTDVTPHRLTSAELDEIVAGVPNGYNDMPVVYDERSTEYVIGKYIKADGTSVPLYQKIIKSTTPTVTTEGTIVSTTIDIEALNISSIAEIKGWLNLQSSGTSYYFALPLVSDSKTVRCVIDLTHADLLIQNNAVSYSNMPVYVAIQYTKS